MHLYNISRTLSEIRSYKNSKREKEMSYSGGIFEIQNGLSESCSIGSIRQCPLSPTSFCRYFRVAGSLVKKDSDLAPQAMLVVMPGTDFCGFSRPVLSMPSLMLAISEGAETWWKSSGLAL